MLEQSYSLLEESLGRLSGLVTETLSALTDGSGDESKREARAQFRSAILRWCNSGAQFCGAIL